MRFPGWPQMGAAFGLGAIMASGQAPIGFWWLTLIGLAALCVMLRRCDGWRAAAWTGLFAGAGYFALSLNWIVEPFLVDPITYGWMAPFAVVLISFGLGLFWALAAGLAHRLAHRTLGFALLLTAAEFARGHVLTGFPWALLGHVWIGSAPAQLAAWAGPTGLTLMTALMAALPVAWRWRGAAVSAALLVAAFGAGHWRLAQPEPAPTGHILRIVQPNAAQEMKWDPDRAEALFRRALDLSAAPGPHDLVIWPETSVPYLLDDYVAEEIGFAAAAPAAVGIQRTEGSRAFNALAVIGPDGAVRDIYDKHHLVPFGEYMPFGDTLARIGITAFAAQLGNGYSPGPGPKVLDMGALGHALPLICYEAVFPQDLRVAERPDWLLQITNDAWFGTLTGPYQHLAQARLRAIEQGLPLVRAANTGVSAMVDAHGRITASLPLGQAGHLDAVLPGALPPTLYARTGEVPVLILLAALLGLALLPRRRAG
ncbi:apolipoprotein N-acyltransferase [Falsirhodobacter algicola]|uniref:Apolipoprotein N-acyltransferase n=1 Tax=Falsirhodobacter algicola TaxID=2692330 RepID=A0A8J8MUC7_9RHOB|nr:apolipoprotein N-acyltransferase [Falsirhodobacter algicola]QUS36604.1 apolipoprotein N-acyltransferase [Falsirhodobacter algicola]